MAKEQDPNHPQSSGEFTLNPAEMAAIRDMARDIRRESGQAPLTRPPSTASTPSIVLPASSPSIALPAPPPPPAPKQPHPVWSVLAPMCFGLVATLFVIAVIPFVPMMLAALRRTESAAEIEAFYAKRRAELRAEADVAREQIEKLHANVPAAAFGFRQVVRKVAPTVVSIMNLREPTPRDDPRGLVYDPEKNRRYATVGTGSGLLFKAGYLLTNHHVVSRADRLRITFASGRILGVDGPSIAGDSYTDLAVVKLPADANRDFAEDLATTAEFADSDVDVEVGDWAIAVGSPLGLQKSVTVGVVSAKGRLLALLDTVELMQTDAAINPGNSGGPLFDQLGRVAGINVAVATDAGVNSGIGFAIPSNTARKIADDLIAHGEVIRGYLGIGLDDLSGQRARALGIPGGVVAIRIAPEDPADRAGVKLGDVIVKFDGREVLRARQLRQMIVDTPPDREIVLHVVRGGERLDVPIKVGKRPVLMP